jgi:hypothetical protein
VPAASRPGSSLPSSAAAGGGGRPVLLATFGVPFDRDGLAFALDAAVESARKLVVANVVRLEPLPLSVMLGVDRLETPELAEALREPAMLARSLGVEVERLRVRTPRPAAALAELVTDVRPGIVVLAPDREQISRRLYRRAVRRLRGQGSCLVWTA